MMKHKYLIQTLREFDLDCANKTGIFRFAIGVFFLSLYFLGRRVEILYVLPSVDNKMGRVPFEFDFHW